MSDTVSLEDRPAPPTELAASRAWRPLATIVACAIVLATLFLLPLLALAANRLVVGIPVDGQAALGRFLIPIATLAVAGIGFLSLGRTRATALLALASLIAALVALLLGLGDGASTLVAGRPAATRASLATGAWTAILTLACAIGIAIRRANVTGLGWLVLAGLTLFVILAGRVGAFDGLSLMVEYRARREAVHVAILRHVALACAAVALGTVAAIALSAWRRAQGIVEILVSGLQVVPAVALLGVLVALVSGLLRAAPPLRELGLSALGPGPAVIGVGAYLLLPLWRGIATGLRTPDHSVIDAATAIGLTPAQTLARVRLPLGAPILIAALRVATVQGIGLATLGALIGAGGLGTIVFEGMAQFAPDLILLGALPIVALSLGADRALSLVEEYVRRRWRA